MKVQGSIVASVMSTHFLTCFAFRAVRNELFRIVVTVFAIAVTGWLTDCCSFVLDIRRSGAT